MVPPVYDGHQYVGVSRKKHSLSRLIGSPPGYVGYGEGGVLTEAIRQRPYSVVLLDEVEKGRPGSPQLVLPSLADKGEMNDGEGRVGDCKNVVFILTSNLGFEIIMDYAEAGGQAIKAHHERSLTTNFLLVQARIAGTDGDRALPAPQR